MLSLSSLDPRFLMSAGVLFMGAVAMIVLLDDHGGKFTVGMLVAAIAIAAGSYDPLMIVVVLLFAVAAFLALQVNKLRTKGRQNE